MNLILFTEQELAEGVLISDPRAKHILEVLRRSPGEPFDVGVIDGLAGKARLRPSDGLRLHFDIELTVRGPALYPIDVLVGMSRPQTMRRVLRDTTSLGAARLCFFPTDRGEAGYAEASLWRSGEYRRHLVEGAQQAFSTRLPDVRLFSSLGDCLSGLGGASFRAALDNYEANRSLPASLEDAKEGSFERVTLAVGSERGWSASERSILRSNGFQCVQLGERVLRTEVACAVAVGIVLSTLGYYEPST